MRRSDDVLLDLNYNSILNRIAEALDRPAELFFDPAMASESQTAELLRVWHAIEDHAVRAKIIAYIRDISDATLP